MSIYLCPSLQASLSAHTHHRKRACPSDRTGACHSCSCSEVLLMSEVCTGFLSSSQLPSSVWASWWQNLYGFQSHTKPGVTSSSLVGFPIFWTQGLPCIIAKKETIVSHFSLFFWEFHSQVPYSHYLHPFSPRCAPVLSALQFITSYFLNYCCYICIPTHTRTHIYVYTHPLESIYCCLYVQMFGADLLGPSGSLSLEKTDNPFLGSHLLPACVHPAALWNSPYPCWHVWFCLATMLLRSHRCSISVVSRRF